MKNCTARSVGLLSAALMFVFAFSAFAPAEAKGLSLKQQLKKSGISLKIERLDRTDGFRFGLSFTGPQGRNFILAPGLGGMFLAQVDGNDIIMQRDSAGGMQLIQADDGTDLRLAFCIVQAVLTFLETLTTADSDPSVVFPAVFELVSNIITCNQLTEPIE